MKQLAVVLALLLGACGTPPRPAPTEGPVTQVNDRMQADDDESNLRFFVVSAIDGQSVMNAAHNSGRLGMGIQTTVMPYIIARHVELNNHRLKPVGLSFTD